MSEQSGARRCERCQNRLVHKAHDGIRFRIKGPIVIDDHGVCHAECFWCSAEVALPLELTKSFAVETERVLVLTRAPGTGSVQK